MNCERAKELFPEVLIGGLDESARAELEAHLRSCALCREENAGLQSVWEKLAALPEGQPGAGLDGRVKMTIEAYREGMKEAKRGMARRPTLVGWLGSLWPKQPAWQLAIAILFFVLGFLIGPGIVRPQRDRPGTSQLREEIASIKQLTALSLLQQPSASERLRGVEWASRLDEPNEQVLSALLRVVELDSNVNVRLAAVDTLQQFIRDPRVRTGLINALARPQSPLVQIDLIHVMVRLKEKDSVVVLRALLQDAEVNPTVRERVEWALQKLS